MPQSKSVAAIPEGHAWMRWMGPVHSNMSARSSTSVSTPEGAPTLRPAPEGAGRASCVGRFISSPKRRDEPLYTRSCEVGVGRMGQSA
jgi:hypothetical protein